MSKIIAFSNAKGGVGKTSICSALAAILAEKGKKVLVICLDPQGNLTATFDSKIYEEDPTPLSKEDTLYGLYQNNQSLPVYDTNIHNLYLSPSHFELKDISDTTVANQYLERRLKEELEKTVDGVVVREKFDFILIDTTPFLGGVLTRSAYIASDSILIITTPSLRAKKGIDQVYKLVEDCIKNGSNIKIEGIVLNKVKMRMDKKEDRNRHLATRITVNELTNDPTYNPLLCKTFIPESDSEGSADIYNRDSWTHNMNSSFSKAALKLAEELHWI